MANAAAALPDDVATLQAMDLTMQSETGALKAEAAQLRAAHDDAEARIARLYAILKMLERARYGRRSEILDDDQERFVFDEIQIGLAAIEAKLEAADPGRVRIPTVRKALPAHLERIEEIIEPDPAPFACGACSRVKIGEDVSERLDVVPSRFRVIVTRRPRHACTACRENIVQAPAPARLIDAGLPTEALLAHVAVSKYADGVPLYQQEAIHIRGDVAIGRNVMADWMGRVGFHLERSPIDGAGPPMVAWSPTASRTTAAAHAPNVISRALLGCSSATVTAPTGGLPIHDTPAVLSRSPRAGRTSVASSTSFTSPTCPTR